jgi:hypothetical protein
MAECLYQLKFVVAQPEGSEPGRTLLAPIAARRRSIAEVCAQEGWRYTPRLYGDLWGDRRNECGNRIEAGSPRAGRIDASSHPFRFYKQNAPPGLIRQRIGAYVQS